MTAVTSSPELFPVVAVSNPCAVCAFHTTLLSHSGPFLSWVKQSKTFLSQLILTSAPIWILQLDQLFFINAFPSASGTGRVYQFWHGTVTVPEPHPTCSGSPEPLCWPSLPAWELGAISVLFQLDSATSESKGHFREARQREGRISYALKNIHGTETSVTTLS